MMEINWMEWIGTIATVLGVVVAVYFGIKPKTPATQESVTQKLTGTEECQGNLEERYRQLALDACDIIDLVNLPEDDRHLATRNLELRQLYVSLRLRLEVQLGDEVDDETLRALEKRRAGDWSREEWEAPGRPGDDPDPVSLGERLGVAKRLVVLGDPGAGKTTLLRWLATAYLLRLQNDPDFRDLPDVASLPQLEDDRGLLPILVRCRDLPADANTLDAMLFHTLKKSELPETECVALGALLRKRLEAGAAILLVDGLDEITEPAARARFSEQLERIHRAYPTAPVVVTSRIVGYREMGYRIRERFEHLVVSDFSRDDKDRFARRWSDLTEHSERREAAAEELIGDIHSSDRIERLTGNPMLLTTMALIKRKIGRLPQRRVDLYEKAVEVLLNWRSMVDKPLDDREALPQLEYLAHAMCADGIQQIRETQVLELLHQARTDYPNIHPLKQHSPEEFLHRLEARTGLLIQSGHAKHDGRSTPVYEFRHLTFQEYLAGLALVQGHYRGRDKDKTLAQAIAPLAGQVGKKGWEDTVVVENWREALRLAVAACNDSDVDEVLAAILRPPPGETGTVRSRAVLAGLCLADEPNVSEQLAQRIVQTLTTQVGKWDGIMVFDPTSLDTAVREIARSRWAGFLGDCLLDEFLQKEVAERRNFGELYSMVRKVQLPSDRAEFTRWLGEQAARLPKCDDREAAGIALTVSQLVYSGKNYLAPELADALIQRLSDSAALAHAVAGALLRMNSGRWAWHPIPTQQQQLIAAAARPDCDSEALYFLSWIFRNERAAGAVDALLVQFAGNHPVNTRRAIAEALGQIGNSRAVHALVTRLRDPEEDTAVRQAAATALGRIGDSHAVDVLVARLQDAEEDRFVQQAAAEALGKIGTEPALAALRDYLDAPIEDVRRAALGGLAQSCQDQTDRQLLSKDLDGIRPWLDPARPIDTARMEEAARELGKPLTEIRRRYEALAAQFGLKVAGNS
uniref:NACHT domain-containing protein n=1 Tax=Candidatus Kentrum sp. TUN TaxID=2126343 RepID=A0A450ZPB1_9GAMM|nr:MAG: NACHT domain-containing protein [Candidatus Kentron sp. TUN]VFK55607.1 MAG: NACHT domain-containing protein [Candidatus Kentron sp. TUN]